MLNNIEDKAKHYCTGCGACVATCPVNAIEYKMNEEGFYQAFVNQEKCVHCGKCKRVCAKFLEKEQMERKIEEGVLYAAKSKETEVVKSCTSGGIAYEIARYGIQNGYKILGTVYDYEKDSAKAIVAENMEDIELLKGSKYIQSATAKAIKDMLELCKKNKEEKFIVFGTPCQIMGISRMIEVNNIQNLIIKIDLFCHGVPSYLVWKKYLEEIKGLGKTKEVVFRDKEKGWHNYRLKIKGEKKEMKQDSERNTFYKAFFDTILYNKPCFTCEVRKNFTAADIRLGDFWGRKFENRQDGVSAVIVYTEQGKNLLQNLQTIELTKEENIQACLENQSRRDYKYIELRNKYIQKLQQENHLKKVIKSYRKDLPLKVRIKNHIKTIVAICPKRVRLLAKKIYHKKLYN